jgi:6-pyruvoyl-tetrahydropterin synthase
MKTVYITRRETFNAAHKLWKPEWSEEKNDEVFGKCANKNWHGHNFELFVTVKGIPNPDTGFVMNLKTLSAIVPIWTNSPKRLKLLPSLMQRLVQKMTPDSGNPK